MDDEFVCGDCFGDQGMKDFCSQHAESLRCDFCGAESDEPIAAPIDDVVRHIKACVYERYDNPDNAGVPYESREGGYQLLTYQTYEVFEEMGLQFPNDEDDRLSKWITNSLGNDLWSEAEPFRLSVDQHLASSWEQFCHVIKHRNRYFFFQEPKEDRASYYDELLTPEEMLDAVFTYAKDDGDAFVTLPAGTVFFRARRQEAGVSYKTAGTLGPPPLEAAVQTNRMSPPGIVMTYVADDRETALAETADREGTYAIGEFVSERELLILDLTGLPETPSPFAELSDTAEYDLRPRLKFLHDVSYDISRPIARDDRVHIEYVPTQVVTEYLRTMFRIEGRNVDGLRYASSRDHVGSAVVLFADQAALVLEKDEQPVWYFPTDRWLRLKGATTASVTQKDLDRWRGKVISNPPGLLDL